MYNLKKSGRLYVYCPPRESEVQPSCVQPLPSLIKSYAFRHNEQHYPLLHKYRSDIMKPRWREQLEEVIRSELYSIAEDDNETTTTTTTTTTVTIRCLIWARVMSRGTCEPAAQWRWQSGHHEQRRETRAEERVRRLLLLELSVKNEGWIRT